jgi:hypothetical protein
LQGRRTQWYASVKYDAHVCYEYDEGDVLGVLWVQNYLSVVCIYYIHPK